MMWPGRGQRAGLPGLEGRTRRTMTETNIESIIGIKAGVISEALYKNGPLIKDKMDMFPVKCFFSITERLWAAY